MYIKGNTQNSKAEFPPMEWPHIDKLLVHSWHFSYRAKSAV